MVQFEYIKILEDIMLPYAEEEMPLNNILVPDKKDLGNGVAS